MDLTLTFGKYRNQLITEVFKKDKQYLRWLCIQPWFKNRHNPLFKEASKVITDYKPDINGNKFIIYTDGACPNNGNSRAKAAIGIHFSETNPIKINDISEMLHTENPSNNLAELTAIYVSLKLIKEKNIQMPIELYTDSKYCQTTLLEWYENWVRENKLHTKKLIPLIKKTYDLYKSFDNIEINYVKAHSKNTDKHSCGNRIADQLARNAIKN